MAYKPSLDAWAAAGGGKIFAQSQEQFRGVLRSLEAGATSVLRAGGLQSLADALGKVDASALARMPTDEVESAVAGARAFLDAVVQTPVSATFTVDAVIAPADAEAKATPETTAMLLERLDRIESALESHDRGSDANQWKIALLMLLIGVVLESAPELWPVASVSIVAAFAILLANE